MATLSPPLNTTQVVGPFSSIADYDAALAWFAAASPVALVTRAITSYIGVPEELTITVTYSAQTADIDIASPI